MADENITASENTTETNEQAATPATQTSKPAVPSPAAMKPHAPSPAAFAKKAPQRPATSTGFSEADIKATEAFGRVADDGTVFVKEGEGEREVGQFPDASKEEALALYARRYLDLKAKLDLFANRLKSSNVKNREIDESIKTLSAEIEQPAVVGDIEALKSQFEALKEAGAAKKAELSEAHKAAVAKALAERTAIVEKAEALANSWATTPTGVPPRTSSVRCSSSGRITSTIASVSTRPTPTPCGPVSPPPALRSTAPAASGPRAAMRSAATPRPRRRPSSPKPRRSRIPPLGWKPPASSTS